MWVDSFPLKCVHVCERERERDVVGQLVVGEVDIQTCITCVTSWRQTTSLQYYGI